MEVLVCEDDPVVRAVISDLVVDQGGRVLAAVESALDAESFLRRFPADVVIVDLALRHGHGLEVIDFLRRARPSTRIIVFTANDTLRAHDHDGVDVVVKPDFERLARVLTSAGERTGERRRPTRASPSADPTTVDAVGFYRLIAAAHPDDVLLRVTVEGGHAAGDGDEVAAALRTMLRGHDFVLQRDDAVVALLIGGGDDTVAALEQRVRATLPHLADRTTSAVVGTDPIATFDRLTTS